MMEHDVIYLQHGEGPIRLEEAGITWCADRINDGDTKYLLATPEREAAPDLLEALRISQAKLGLAIDADDWGLVDSALYIIVATIARVAPPADVADVA